MLKTIKNRSHREEALMRYARLLGFGDIHTKIDAKNGLHAIIAVHSTKRGPAIGGCRFYPYKSTDLALKDAIRLSYMMTLKAAAAGIPHGGAKAVIIKPPKLKDRDALFRSFGDFVQELNGRYITALDVGTTSRDMDMISERTPYVVGAAGVDPMQTDPSPYTSKGIFQGIRAAVKFKYQREDLKGLRVAIQGAGRVAYYLAKLLHEAGVKITVSDIQVEALERFVKEFDASVVGADKIYDVDGDIFSPCAIGGTINLDSINRFKVKIIAGGANNQLAHKRYGEIIHHKDILYVPDYVLNAGGLIQASSLYDYRNLNMVDQRIEALYDRLLYIFERAAELHKPTTEVSEIIALERLNETKA